MTRYELREAMAARRWTAGALGARIGVNRTTVQKWLAGDDNISKRTELSILYLANREDVSQLAALRDRVALLEGRLDNLARLARLP